MSRSSTYVHETTYFRLEDPKAENDPNAYVKREQVDAAQHKQDEGIRREFGVVHEKLDTIGTEIREVKAEIQELQHKTGNLESDVKDVQVGMKDLRVEVKDLRAITSNPLAYGIWHDIFPISSDGRYPDRFPNKVVKFWRLKDPELMALIRFYDLDFPFLYDIDEGQYSTSEGEDETQLLEQAESFEQRQRLSESALQKLVKDQRLSTLQMLADHLKMDFAAIRSCMSQGTSNVSNTTRKRIVEGDDCASPEEKKSKLVAPTKLNDSFIRELTRDPEEQRTASEKSSDGHITWDRGTWLYAHRLRIKPRSALSGEPSGSTEKLSSSP